MNQIPILIMNSNMLKTKGNGAQEPAINYFFKIYFLKKKIIVEKWPGNRVFFYDHGSIFYRCPGTFSAWVIFLHYTGDKLFLSNLLKRNSIMLLKLGNLYVHIRRSQQNNYLATSGLKDSYSTPEVTLYLVEKRIRTRLQS